MALAKLRGRRRLTEQHRNDFIIAIQPLVYVFVCRSVRACKLFLQPDDLADVTAFVNLHLVERWFARIDRRRSVRVVAGYLQATVHGLCRRWLTRRQRQRRCPPERRRYSAIDHRFAEVDLRLDEAVMEEQIASLTERYLSLRPHVADKIRDTVQRMMRLLVREECGYA